VYEFPQLLKKDKVESEMAINLEGFQDLGNFAYLTRSSCTTLKDVNDIEMFERRINAMQTIGIDPADVAEIINVVAAVLHMGNLKFEAPPSNSEGAMVMKECVTSINVVARLTGVDRKDLENALCNTTRVARGETLRSPVNIRQASDNRDALAKAMYAIIFNFIVHSTNLSIGYMEDVDLFVGVLDIFGFECFQMNSFEQVCINFTNERLQNFFNSFVFKLEEQLYEREGISWDRLDFPDNQDAVDILQAKNTGVFAILDEECLVPQGSDQGFCNKIMKQHRGHRRFDEIKTKPSWFVIKHFAGPVSYCTDGFLDKNKDQLSHDLITCMGGSSNTFLGKLFRNDAKYAEAFCKDDSDRKQKKKYTVSLEFKDQLASLMDVVDLTEPHFIRCIKPNPNNEPDRYDRKSVTEQLRYGGVLQVVQVSRAGYPVRINHQECWDDFKIVAAPTVVAGLRHVDDAKIRAQKLLEHLSQELNIPKPKHGLAWAVGATMVFFKLAAFERVKFARLELLIKSTTRIQANWRRKVRVDAYKAVLICTRHIEALLRMKQAREDLYKRREQRAATLVQALARKVSARKRWLVTLRRVVQLQAWRRGLKGRRRALAYRRFVSARKIQRNWRRRQEHLIFAALRKSILLAQGRWRMHHAKVQMKKLQKEAKEVGALMAKNQKATEQANELRRRNDELEAVQLQLQFENKSLTSKVKTLEEGMQELRSQLEEAQKAASEAARLAADTSKMIVETEKINDMERTIEESAAENTKLRAELAEAQEVSLKQSESLEDAEGRYHQLLKSATMQSMAGLNGCAGGSAVSRVAPATRGGKGVNRNVFIQLCGFQGVGKSSLLEALIRQQDPEKVQNFNEQRSNLMSHHQIQVGERSLKLLDCSGNVRAQHLVKEWFARSHFVFLVYDMSNPKTLEYALEMTKEVHAAGAKVVLFGNKYNVDQGSPVRVDVMSVKDAAVRNEGLAIESLALIDAVKMIATDSEGEEANMEAISAEDDKSSLSAALDSVKTWFGPRDRVLCSDLQQGVLTASLRGTKAIRQAIRESANGNGDLKPVQELTDSESAITCMCFGQERVHKAYILLATASKDGTVVIYRCYRTEMEIAMLSDQDFPGDDTASSFSTPPADHSNIAVHSRLVGHSRAITSLFFNMLEDQLVTTSIDKSVRFWQIDSGEMMKVFTDSSPVPVAMFLPFNQDVFVAANSSAVIRLVNVMTGAVQQKLKVETEVRALRFDDSGMYLLAGTKSGSIHVLEASDSTNLKFRFKVQLARGIVTCITFVAAQHGQPPCLLVNTSDSCATIIDCTYRPEDGVLTNLAVRHRVKVAHSLLPLKCCHSPSGQGFLISGSEDKDVYIFSLAKGADYKKSQLKYHQVPVVAVAVNHQDTLLASADSLGCIVLWRRMDFSHLPELPA